MARCEERHVYQIPCGATEQAIGALSLAPVNGRSRSTADIHHKLNATRFAAEIHREANRLKGGGGALFVSGAHFQTADADRVFPWQRRERVVEFNREARVAAEAAGGRFVDLAPATEGARATSDGVHYLTAVNLVKARIFIALLHMSHDI